MFNITVIHNPFHDETLTTLEIRQSIDAHFDMTGLIQITNSASYKVDSNAVDRYCGQRPIIVLRKPQWMTHTNNLSTINKYVKFFPGCCRYIALMPNMESCDKYRLVPAITAISLSLYAAFITTGAFDDAHAGA